MTNKIVYITMFSSSICGNCKPMKQTLESMREEYGQGIEIIYREVDTNPRYMELAREWQVSAVPTTIFITDATERAKIIGNAPAEQVREAIERALQSEVLPNESGGSE